MKLKFIVPACHCITIYYDNFIHYTLQVVWEFSPLQNIFYYWHKHLKTCLRQLVLLGIPSQLVMFINILAFIDGKYSNKLFNLEKPVIVECSLWQVLMLKVK